MEKVWVIGQQSQICSDNDVTTFFKTTVYEMIQSQTYFLLYNCQLSIVSYNKQTLRLNPKTFWGLLEITSHVRMSYYSNLVAQSS